MKKIAEKFRDKKYKAKYCMRSIYLIRVDDKLVPIIMILSFKKSKI